MALAIVLGAFGAHLLRDHLSVKMLNAYQTGVLYHMVHALGMIAIWAFREKINNEKVFKQSLILLSLGTIMFSGSIYLLSLNECFNGGFQKWIGPITPIGGVLMIAGWLRLALNGMNGKGQWFAVFFILGSMSSFAQISISNVTTYKADLQWVSSAEAQGYMVVRAQGNYAGTPVELMSYSIGDTVGNGQVAYLGNGLGYTQWALRAYPINNWSW